MTKKINHSNTPNFILLLFFSLLAPLPLHNCPVHWDFDQSMWLYPLPDLVVIGDKLDHFTSESFEGCQVVNPGSFGKNEYSFKTYVPKLKLVEDSQVPEDETA